VKGVVGERHGRTEKNGRGSGWQCLRTRRFHVPGGEARLGSGMPTSVWTSCVHGLYGNFEKSGSLFCWNALRPSWPSSVW